MAEFHSYRLRYGPVFSAQLGLFKSIVSCNPIDIAQINKYPRPASIVQVFTEALPGGLFAMSNSQHANARSNLAKHFNNNLLYSMQPRFAAAVLDLVGRLERHPHHAFDISPELVSTALHVIGHLAFNLDLDGNTRLLLIDAARNLFQQMMICVGLYPFCRWFAPFGAMRSVTAMRQAVDQLCSDLSQEWLRTRDEG